MKVLVVDDDVDLLDLMSYALRREGFTVLAAADGVQALERWESDQPDIVLLDGNLPRLDGFEVCRRIRHAGRTPVIMLTARDDEDDVVRGLHGGADDYITKPFSAKQLMARMRSVLRRSQPNPAKELSNEIRVGDLTLLLQSHEVTKAGEHIQLTRLEFRILNVLALNEGQVVQHSRLGEYVWGTLDSGVSPVVKTHVSHLRRKLGLKTKGPGSIRAVGNVGYIFTSD